jgi:thymidylate synthase (FAD)
MIIWNQSAQVEQSDTSYGSAVANCEYAGRTCYSSHADSSGTLAGGEKFIEERIKQGHESVIEHASLTVTLIVDRAIMAELTRHRLASYSVLSTRYVNFSETDCVFIQPMNLTDEQILTWRKVMQASETAYKEMIKSGCTPETARSVLPMSLATEVVMTANMREWRHILKMRTAKGAHPQMRAVMVYLLKVLRSTHPAFFKDIKVPKDIVPCDYEECACEECTGVGCNE